MMFKVRQIFTYFIPVLMLFLAVGCGNDKTAKKINAGEPFTVFLDKLDVDLGTISKGSTFEVKLKDGRFEATGIPKGDTSPKTHSYAVGKSDNPNSISIWGVDFQYDSNNNLLLKNKIVGRLVLKGK